MASTNVEIVQELLDAFRRRDHEREFELLSENVVWDCRAIPIPGCDEVFHRHSGVKTFWSRWLEAWEKVEWDQIEITALGECVLAGFNQRNLGRESGIWVEYGQWWGLYELRDGEVVRLTYFSDRDQALRQAGAQPEGK